MRSVIKISKLIDDAVSEALSELNVGKDDVKIEILEEPSKGLFGLIGGKDAVVKGCTVVYDPIEIAENFISKLLASMDIKAVTIVKKEEDCIKVNITDHQFY